MRTPLKVDFTDHCIIMTRAFEKRASDVRSEEYEILQKARNDYPSFSIVIRSIKRNSDKKTYKNLTYYYMQKYITSHGTKEEQQANLKEFLELRIIGECHTNAKAYATIKSWFLQKYPEVAQFGVIEPELDEEPAATAAPTEETMPKAS